MMGHLIKIDGKLIQIGGKSKRANARGIDNLL